MRDSHPKDYSYFLPLPRRALTTANKIPQMYPSKARFANEIAQQIQ
jgi:hypothetical protein